MRTVMTLFAVLALVGVGCTEDEPCDSQTELVGGNCQKIVFDAAPAPDAPPAIDAAPGEPDAAPSVAFGTACNDSVSHTDCGGDTDYCAKSPGQQTGYCTATGCEVSASMCPQGWSCFDLGQFGAGLPHICMKP